MLEKLQFTNFKSWATADLSCGTITGIFGTNSSGKTSLLQFLLLLKQTKNATDRALPLDLNGDLVRLGTIRDAVRNHAADGDMSWDVRFGLPQDVCFVIPAEV